MIEQPGRDYCAEALKSAGMKRNGRANSGGDHQHGEPQSDGQTAKFKKEDAWPIMDDAAYYGLAGEIVRTIAPHSEADPVALLDQVLVFFGNEIGNSAHYRVEADHHHANVFSVLVGQSAKGRKGTSGGRARSVMQAADAR
jgi:hypothetical protein